MRRCKVLLSMLVCAFALTACPGPNPKPIPPIPSVPTVSTVPPLSQTQLQSIIDKLQSENQIPTAPSAPQGADGLANAPSNPQSSDQAEATFDRFIFGELVTFWTQTEHQPVGQLTLQPVDSTNNPVSCGGDTVQVDQGGPFYCPDDGQGVPTIYWPLQSLFSLPSGQSLTSFGPFAEAAGIAHEFGHHMQDVAGFLQSYKQNESNDANNGDNTDAALWSQDIELQADCLAGVWMRSQWDANVVTQADLNSAADLFNSLGDDSLNPLSVTNPQAGAHGDSAQRVHWLNVGLQTGSPGQCYTWNEPLYATS